MVESAVIVVSNSCNLYCPHCFKDAMPIKNVEVPTEDVLKFLDTFPSLNHLRLTGGEPLAPFNYGRTKAFVDYILQKQGTAHINTNGTNEFSHQIIDPIKFQVSLDGFGEVHDNIRGKGVFDKAVQFIQIQKAKGHDVKVMHVLMGQHKNLRSLEKFIDYVTIGLQVPLELQFATPNGRGRYLKQDDKISEVSVQQLLESRVSNKGIRDCTLRRRKTQCPLLLSSERLSIDECGHITPCPMLGKYKFGTIYDYNADKVREDMQSVIQNCTCNYPDGVPEG